LQFSPVNREKISKPKTVGKRQQPHILVNTIIAEEHGSLESVDITPRRE